MAYLVSDEFWCHQISRKHPLLSSVNESCKFREGQWAPIPASTERSYEAPPSLQAQNAPMRPPPCKHRMLLLIMACYLFDFFLIPLWPQNRYQKFLGVQPSRLEATVSRKLLFLSSQNAFYKQPELWMFNEANSSVLHKLIKLFLGPPPPPLKSYLVC